MIGLRCGRYGGFALLKIFRHHHAHRIAQTNFRQQIVQRCELHTLQFALDILLRDFSQFTAAAEGMVEQTAPQADGIITLEVLQQLANFGASF